MHVHTPLHTSHLEGVVLLDSNTKELFYRLCMFVLIVYCL